MGNNHYSFKLYPSQNVSNLHRRSPCLLSVQCELPKTSLSSCTSTTPSTNTVEFNCKREKTTKNDGYGQKEVVCTRTPKQDCYNIPRKIQVEVCKTDVHR